MTSLISPEEQGGGEVAPEKIDDGTGAGGTVDDAGDPPCWKSTHGSSYCSFPLTMSRDRVPLLLLLPLTSEYLPDNPFQMEQEECLAERQHPFTSAALHTIA